MEYQTNLLIYQSIPKHYRSNVKLSFTGLLPEYRDAEVVSSSNVRGFDIVTEQD